MSNKTIRPYRVPSKRVRGGKLLDKLHHLPGILSRSLELLRASHEDSLPEPPEVVHGRPPCHLCLDFGRQRGELRERVTEQCVASECRRLPHQQQRAKRWLAPPRHVGVPCVLAPRCVLVMGYPVDVRVSLAAAVVQRRCVEGKCFQFTKASPKSFVLVVAEVVEWGGMVGWRLRWWWRLLWW